MREGTITVDGEAREVLTNPEVLTQASIVPPQIAQIFMQLSDFGLPQNVIDVYEAHQILLKALEKRAK
jgi:hypothetical protein